MPASVAMKLDRYRNYYDEDGLIMDNPGSRTLFAQAVATAITAPQRHRRRSRISTAWAR